MTYYKISWMLMPGIIVFADGPVESALVAGLTAITAILMDWWHSPAEKGSR